MIVGLDFETTGLDTDHLCVVEIALVLFTDDLKDVDMYTALIALPEDFDESQMNEVALEMHKKSGLWSLVQRRGKPLSEVQAEIEVLFDKWAETCYLRRAPLLGNSVHFDRAIFRRLFRKQHDMLSHRNIDVSSVNELAHRWEPTVVPRTHMSHRALDDIFTSVKTIKAYRESWFNLTVTGKIKRTWERVKNIFKKG